MAKQVAIIDQHSADVIRRMARHVVRQRSDGTPEGGEDSQKDEGTDFLGLAIVTNAGADADHWKWAFALRNNATGRWFASQVGSDENGECVIADALPAGVGTIGALYVQLDDDSVPTLTLVPIATRGMVVVVTAAAGGIGVYLGYELIPNAGDVDPDDDLSEATLGTRSDGVEIGEETVEPLIILNLQEINGNSESDHDLLETVNTDHATLYFNATLLHVNSDGRKVVTIDGFPVTCECDCEEEE